MEKEWKAYEIGELDQYLFGQGNHYEIYKKLGAHMVDDEGQEGVYFAVWAPNAKSVSVVGEFNDWDRTRNPMTRAEYIGIYTCFVPGVKEGMPDLRKHDGNGQRKVLTVLGQPAPQSSQKSHTKKSRHLRREAKDTVFRP